MERLRLGEIPALVASRGGAEHAARRGTVLVYHPLGKDKDVHAGDLARLAESGFLAIGVDAIAHGERRIAHGMIRFLADPLGALREVVSSTAAEVPGLIDLLLARGWAHPGRIGIAGVSLGGFVAYGAAVADRRITAAACLLASPDWGGAVQSPLRNLDRIFPLALLSVTASADAVVPPGPARRLHAALAPRYASAPERLRHVELAGERHHLSDAAWNRAQAEADAWFERFLGEDSAQQASAPP
jgi:dienelactone hydrolase